MITTSSLKLRSVYNPTLRENTIYTSHPGTETWSFMMMKCSKPMRLPRLSRSSDILLKERSRLYKEMSLVSAVGKM
jgi:hypothetical protein